LAAIVFGVAAGCLFVDMHYALFSMAYYSTVVPNTLAFAIVTRLAHVAPLYLIFFIFLITVAVWTSEQISDSMDSNETRMYMRYL
jgi:hypothetical protein